MTETLAHGHSSESIQREISNEYQNDRVRLVFNDLCLLVFWMKEALALEGMRILRHLLGLVSGQIIV